MNVRVVLFSSFLLREAGLCREMSRVTCARRGLRLRPLPRIPCRRLKLSFRRVLVKIDDRFVFLVSGKSRT
jgi:hypothetical protein